MIELVGKGKAEKSAEEALRQAWPGCNMRSDKEVCEPSTILDTLRVGC